MMTMKKKIHNHQQQGMAMIEVERVVQVHLPSPAAPLHLDPDLDLIQDHILDLKDQQHHPQKRKEVLMIGRGQGNRGNCVERNE